MSKYKFFIYRVESHATAIGEYLGPFATEHERDEAARRLRNKNKSQNKRARLQSVYRANVEEELVATLVSPAIVAA